MSFALFAQPSDHLVMRRQDSNRYSSVTDESGISDPRCSTPVGGGGASYPSSHWSSECDYSPVLSKHWSHGADFVSKPSKVLNKASPRQSDHRTSGEKPKKRQPYCCETLEVMHLDFGEAHKQRTDGCEDMSPEARGIPIMPSTTETSAVLPFAGVLKLSLYMNSSLMTINVQRGRNLKSSTTKRANAYVRLSLMKNGVVNLSCKTKTVRKTNNPVFNEKFSFELPTEPDCEMSVSVWNKSNDGKSHCQYMGSTTFVVQDIVQRTRAVNGWFFLLPNQTIGDENWYTSSIPSTASETSDVKVSDQRFDLKHKTAQTFASTKDDFLTSSHCLRKKIRLPDVYENPDLALFTSTRYEEVAGTTSSINAFNHHGCDALDYSRQSINQFHRINWLPSNYDGISCVFPTRSPTKQLKVWNCPDGLRITSYGWLDGCPTDCTEPGLTGLKKQCIKYRDINVQTVSPELHLLGLGLHPEIDKTFESDSQRPCKSRTLKRQGRNSEYVPNNLANKSKNLHNKSLAGQRTRLPKNCATEHSNVKQSKLLSSGSDHHTKYFPQRLHRNELDSNTGLLSSCAIENIHHYENLLITQPDLTESRTCLQATGNVYESIIELQTTPGATVPASKTRLSNTGLHTCHKTISCLNYWKAACSRIMQLMKLSTNLSPRRTRIAGIRSKSSV